ncbi:hypothetical protein KC727_03000 [Candidatus Kaiserbacteria bacterium]|nr:hypothetical protein [Candidatus Kaiserbacteria bacterium]
MNTQVFRMSGFYRFLAHMGIIALLSFSAQGVFVRYAQADHDAGAPYEGEVLGAQPDVNAGNATITGVEICHATGSDSNPYSNPTVNINSFFSDGHDSDLQDIIPPFHYYKDDTLQSFAGTNWDAVGQALYYNGCIESIPVEILGCTDSDATNYEPDATADDGSCEYPEMVTFEIKKNAGAAGATTYFDFTGDLGDFSILGNNSDTFSVMVPAGPAYSFSEIVGPDWTPATTFCRSGGIIGQTGDNGEINDIGTVYPDTFATPIVDGTITCTFGNVYTPDGFGHITVVKEVADGDTDQSFNFTASWGNFSLSANSDPEVSPDLSAGVYSVSEDALPEGWSLEGATCSDGSTPDAIDLEADEEVTCTFTNRYGTTPEICSVTIVSDETAIVEEKGGAFAKLLSFIHANWTAAIDGASWIWGDDPVVDPTINETQTFVNQFGWSGTVASATLYVAADNNYTATINGADAGSDISGGNFGLATQDTYDVSGLIQQGNNDLAIAVTNLGMGGANATGNPSGALYKLVVTTTDPGDCAPPYDGGGGTTDPEIFVPDCSLEDSLIVNGSFEDPVVENINGWDRFASVLGWVIEKLSDNTPTTLELHRNWLGNAAADAEQYAELDGDQSTRITQAVATEVGATYQLYWASAPRHDTAAENNDLRVAVDGVEVAATGPESGSNPLAQTDWTYGSHSFVAGTTTTDISLYDGGPSDTFGTFVDDVRLCKIADPEPETPTSPTGGGGGGGSTSPSCQAFGVSAYSFTPGDILTLDWETKKGEELSITANGIEIFSTTNGTVVDNGSLFVAPIGNTVYELTVSKGSKSDTCTADPVTSGEVLGAQTSVTPLGAADTGLGGASHASQVPTVVVLAVMLLALATVKATRVHA